MKIGFYRHGPTAWNLQKRLQGRTDVGLTNEARAWLAAHQLPGGFRPARCLTSPLIRAVETAEFLSPVQVKQEPSLIEANWGDWEGKTIRELREADPETMAREEDRGLDMTPPNGESPRDVCKRLSSWFDILAQEHTQGAHLAVTHKGVIRAAMALATEWNFIGKPPEKLDWQCLHVFEVGPDGRLSMAEINIPLEPKS